MPALLSMLHATIMQDANAPVRIGLIVVFVHAKFCIQKRNLYYFIVVPNLNLCLTLQRDIFPSP